MKHLLKSCWKWILLLLFLFGMVLITGMQAEKASDIEVLPHREGELVFSMTLADYIDRYNDGYWKDYKTRYLPPASEWRSQRYDTAIHSSHAAICYDFTEDETKWSLPTISIYVPADSDQIQELTIDFDDHSYTEATYDLYEELCFYTLQVFFPDMEEAQIIALYQTLNRLAYDNMFPNEQGYGSGIVPCALFYQDGIGLYPYFAEGESLHLCIIPVTEQTINEFTQKGTVLYEIATMQERQPASKPAPLYDIAPDIVPVSAESVIFADLPADELDRITQICQNIASICGDLFQTAEKVPSPYMPDQLVLAQSSIDAIEERLIQQGYPVLDTDSTYPSFLQNADGMYRFRDAVQNGLDGRQDYIWISPYGGFQYCSLETRADGPYFLEAAAQWNERNEIEITELYKREVLDWDLTENGNFYYKLYEAHSPAFEDYTLLRLKEVSHELYDLSAAYIEQVGYQSNNLFTCSWNHTDYGALCFNDLLEFCYRMNTEQILDISALPYRENPFYYQIPAVMFEESILPYFDISLQTFREKTCYDKNSNTYPWLDVAYDNLSYFPLITPEVKACQQNSDGTITLTVDAMCVGLKQDSLFRHKVTIRLQEGGGFQYVQNQMITTSQELPAYQPRLQMQRG